MIDGDAKKEELSFTLVYYYKGGELFAKDLEQHLAELQEVAVSSTEITIDDVVVGDPGVPLTEDK